MKKMIEVVSVLAVLGVLTSCQSGKKEISQETTRSMSGAGSAGRLKRKRFSSWKQEI